MHKLKAALRSSRKDKSPSSRSSRQSYESPEPASPVAKHHASPSDGRGQTFVNGSHQSASSHPRSRPVSSAYDPSHASRGQPRAEINNNQIPPFDFQQSTNLEDREHEEAVADRNIKRYSAEQRSANSNVLGSPTGSRFGTDILSHIGQDDGRGQTNTTATSAQGGTGHRPMAETPGTTTDRDATRPHRVSANELATNNTDHHDHSALPAWKLEQQAQLKGIVDLTDTVDTDRKTQWAAPIVHETIKPHEHEIIQHKIHREIHNYTYYHRMQPIMHTEVLPPRHYIPDPNDNSKLLEISADELPSRTGQNRWWEIVQKHVELPHAIQPSQPAKPRVIHGEVYTTTDGIERKETTIIYPPTLADMSDYTGPVHPLHFDHKTGESWLEEETTMGNLRQQYDQDVLTMNELTAALPDVPDSPTVKRKPVAL